MEGHNSIDFKIEEGSKSRRDSQYLGLLPICVLLLIIIVRVMFVLCKNYGQKTRTPAQRVYVGSRARQSLSHTEPTIYVSPANLPPPPKYECLAPPSYEEVVGIHYPQFQGQPIAQPIASAMAQSSAPVNVTTAAETPTTVVTVTSETRSTSVQVAAS